VRCSGCWKWPAPRVFPRPYQSFPSHTHNCYACSEHGKYPRAALSCNESSYSLSQTHSQDKLGKRAAALRLLWQSSLLLRILVPSLNSEIELDLALHYQLPGATPLPLCVHSKPYTPEVPDFLQINCTKNLKSIHKS